MSSDSVNALFAAGPRAEYVLGETGFRVFVFRVPSVFNLGGQTINKVFSTSELELRYGNMVVVVDASSHVVAYQRVSESTLEWDPAVPEIRGSSEARFVGQIIALILAQEHKQ